MSIVEDIRIGLEDVVSPELSGIKESVNGIKDAVHQLRADLTETEKRLLASIEAGKKEILLTLQVATLSERVAEQELMLQKLRSASQPAPASGGFSRAPEASVPLPGSVACETSF